MTDEQHRNFYEYLKNMDTYGKDCRVVYLYNGMSYKCDCWGDIRLVIIPVQVQFNNPNKKTGYYNLLLKPKKNELSWESRWICEDKYPTECLKVFEQFGLKII